MRVHQVADNILRTELRFDFVQRNLKRILLDLHGADFIGDCLIENELDRDSLAIRLRRKCDIEHAADHADNRSASDNNADP